MKLSELTFMQRITVFRAVQNDGVALKWNDPNADILVKLGLLEGKGGMPDYRWYVPTDKARTLVGKQA